LAESLEKIHSLKVSYYKVSLCLPSFINQPI